MWWIFLIGLGVGFVLGSAWMYFLTLNAAQKLIEENSWKIR
jgi:hypothetical protein